MEKIQLGNSNLKITPITFGAWAIGGWMWGGANEKDAKEAVHASVDAGITTIDTAPVYGFGKSEELVGKAIQEIGQRDHLQILTKFGLRWDTEKGEFYFETEDDEGNTINIHKFAGKENIIKECEDSLKRLRTDYIDLYQIHWPDKTTPIEESMEAVQKLKDDGKIKEAGVCNYSVDEIKIAEKVISLVSNQVPYSMVNRTIEKDVVPYCREKNIGILAYSPLQRGLLTGKISEDHDFNYGDHRPSTPYFKPENIVKVNQFLADIESIAQEHYATTAQLVINWTIQQPGITSALVGARNRKQVDDNARAISFQLSEEEIKIINQKLSELNLDL